MKTAHIIIPAVNRQAIRTPTAGDARENRRKMSAETTRRNKIAERLFGKPYKCLDQKRRGIVRIVIKMQEDKEKPCQT